MKAVLLKRIFQSTKDSGPQLIGVAGELVNLTDAQAKDFKGSFSTDKEQIEAAEKRQKASGKETPQNKAEVAATVTKK